MDTTPISPWVDRAERQSPDGCHIAVYQNGMEVAMGAPTRGELRVTTPIGDGHLVADDAAASFVWSNDSRFLAFSKWRSNMKQSLCVLQLADMTVDESPDEFIVLELRGFSDGKIEGVDSPVHMPRTFSLKYGEANK